EHAEFYDSIRRGQPLNDGEHMCNSTLMAIMGRMAAYTGQEITWEQALNSQEKLVPDNLRWDMELPIAPMAVPGKTKYVSAQNLLTYEIESDSTPLHKSDGRRPHGYGVGSGGYKRCRNFNPRAWEKA